MRALSRTFFAVAGIALLSVAASFGEPNPAMLSRATALAIYAPRPVIPAEVCARHLSGAGVFVVYLRPDGTVSHAKVLQSTGQPILDKVSIDAFSKWRFRATTVKKVKIPITYTAIRWVVVRRAGRNH
jgi:TonB family protein